MLGKGELTMYGFDYEKTPSFPTQENYKNVNL
jgi:hypothetical protein